MVIKQYVFYVGVFIFKFVDNEFTERITAYFTCPAGTKVKSRNPIATLV
jgi:hypothetical protein